MTSKRQPATPMEQTGLTIPEAALDRLASPEGTHDIRDAVPESFGGLPSISEYEDRDIIVYGWTQPEEAKFEDSIILMIRDTMMDEGVVEVWGTSVIRKQVLKAQERGMLPVYGRVVKVGRYYQLA